MIQDTDAESVRHRQTKQALAQAKTISSQPPIDLTRPEVRGITIDGPTSLDLDDAIWCEALKVNT
ncbi:MAG: hypothetical protein WA902_15680 [Thermosynechococcaceae cyanobacterium]